MNKSIIIIFEEFKENFANLINDSGLPACMIESVLENYLQEVKIMSRRQYELDKKQYEESLHKLKEHESKGEEDNEN